MARVDRPATLAHKGPAALGDLLVHRRLLQPPPPTLQPRHGHPGRVREVVVCHGKRSPIARFV